jgi:hypothetical protein
MKNTNKSQRQDSSSSQELLTVTQKHEEELKTVNRVLISQLQEQKALKKGTSEMLDEKVAECSALQATLQTVIAEKKVLESQCRDQEEKESVVHIYQPYRLDPPCLFLQ